MNRAENRTLTDIPKEVRHSLEFLDEVLDTYDQVNEEYSRETLRKLNDVPVDVRRSLDILDDILGQYDIEEKGPPGRKYESAENLRSSHEVSQEVSKSLEMLDSVLDEFESDCNRYSLKRQQRREKQKTLDRSVRHDDIRKSLEVLDNVLAEFDDCLESWDTPLQNANESNDIVFHVNKNLEHKESQHTNGRLPSVPLSHENHSTDGSTSRNFCPSVQEQPKVISPPPIPKRSSTTKLSDRNSSIFTFPTDNLSLDSYDSTRSDADNEVSLSRSLHLAAPITSLSLGDDDVAGQEDDVFPSLQNRSQPGSCANCGRDLKGLPKMDAEDQNDVASSPFLQRRQMFEDKITEATSQATRSPVLKRPSNGSSFRVRKWSPREQESPSSGVSTSPESGFVSNDSPVPSPRQLNSASSDSLNAIKLSPPTAPYHAPNCNCKERIRQLDKKFAETRKLLKANKIKGLDQNPPSFAPPSVPTIKKDIRHNEISKVHLPNKLPSDSSDITQSLTESFKTSTDYDGSNTDLYQTANSSIHGNSKLSKGHESSNSLKQIEQPILCNRCSRTVPIHLAETIEDLPKLLPTDALNRPQLGLSYSMEDDLSPGVKEIRQTSTPKSSLPYNVNNKDVSSLSTFSLSASSLGYVSSQSDLELNNSLSEPDKVPVSSIRSQTLPVGMNLTPSPFYSSSEQSPENDCNDNRMYRDRNFNHTSASDLQLRSSSAPPLPETEKPKKKHFRGFSRKDKKKNDDSLSVKSDMSLDEGIILKKIEALDGATDKYDVAVDRTEAGVEKKRWSVLRSILRKR